MDKPKIMCTMICAGVVGFIALIALIAVGSTVVREYNLAKNYRPTTCTSLGIKNLGMRSCQYCYTTYTSTWYLGKRKTESKRKCRPSTYPCIRATVKYTDKYGKLVANATFYPDVLQAGESLFCSFYACNKNPHASEVAVQTEVSRYQQKVSLGDFECFYDKTKPMHVIGRKIHTYKEVLIGMTLPGVIAAIAGICLLYGCGVLCFSKRKDYSVMKNPGDAQSNVGVGKDTDTLIGPNGMGDKVIGPAQPLPTQPPSQPGFGTYPPMPTYNYDPTKSTTPSFPPSVPPGANYPPMYPPPGPQGGAAYPPPGPQPYPPPGPPGAPMQYPPPGPPGYGPAGYPGPNAHLYPTEGQAIYSAPPNYGGVTEDKEKDTQ